MRICCECGHRIGLPADHCQFHNGIGKRCPCRTAIVGITPEEARALKLRAMGMESKDIARALGKSVNTIQEQLWSAKKKINAPTIPMMLAMMLRQGILTIEDLPRSDVQIYLTGNAK